MLGSIVSLPQARFVCLVLAFSFVLAGPTAAAVPQNKQLSDVELRERIMRSSAGWRRLLETSSA